MFNAKRKGIALITVVLISALIFASIVGITLKVIPENKIVAARSASQRALSAAETGLSQALFNLRNADFISGGRTTVPPGTTDSSLTYLTINDVENIAKATAGAVLPSTSTTYGEVPVPGGNGVPYVTYQVKIKKISGDSFSESYDKNTLDNVLEIYSLGTVYDKQGGNVVARKAIMMSCATTFKVNPATPETPGSNPVNVNYGIVSGGNMNFVGNANRVFQGDIYAGGDIMKNSNNDNSTIVLDGNAYAHGSVDPGIVPDAVPPKKYEGVSSPSSTIDKIITELSKYNKSLADAFIAGAYPYDGTVDGYPNTNLNDSTTFPDLTVDDKEKISEIMSDYLLDSYIAPKNPHDSDYDGRNVLTFYNDIISGKIKSDNITKISTFGLSSFTSFFNELATAKDKIIVYYNGSFDKSQEVDQLFNLNIGGTIVVEGDLKINSSGTINQNNNSLLLVVKGNIDLAGGATLNCGKTGELGGIFASGENANSKVGVGNFTLNGYLVTPRDIDVNGTFSCNGTLMTKGSIDLQGTTNITFVNRGLGNIQVIPMPPSGPEPASLENVASAGQNSNNPSSWQEISYDEFDKLKNP